MLFMVCLIAEGPSLSSVSAQNAGAAPQREPGKQTYTVRELNEQLVMAALWVRTSAEYRALCLQAYNLAKMMLDKDLAGAKTDRKRIIVADVDDVIIQTIGYETDLITTDTAYPAKWLDWVAGASGQAVPGSVEFLNYAASKGVETYYLTNRRVGPEFQGTLDNLKKLGCPIADTGHLLLEKEATFSDKRPRELPLENEYHVVLYLGDNLDDFPENFFGKSVEERRRLADAVKNEWGKRYIMFPNPLYGSWERALKNYKSGLSPDEQYKIRRSLLRP